MVLLKFLLPLFFFVFALGELPKIGFLTGASVGLLDLILVPIIAIWLFKVKKHSYELKKSIVIFIGFCILSLVLNLTRFTHQQILISSLYLVRFVYYSLLYFIIRDLGKEYGWKITRYLTFSGIVILLIGFLQFAFYPSLKNLYYLGWDEHMYRLFSTFLDPNFTGVILVMFFVFIFILRDKIFRKKYFTYVLLLLTFLGIILTYSRGALLMFAICALTYSILLRNWKFVAAAMGTLVVVFIILSPRFYLENTNLLRTVSTRERIETSKKALEIFQKNPMGVGFDTYRYARQKYGEVDQAKYGVSHSGAGVDNSLVFVLVTTGILGLGSYLYLLYKMFRLGSLNIKKNKYALVLAVTLPGLIINSLTINSLFYSFIMIWVWILAGLTESSLRE